MDEKPDKLKWGRALWRAALLSALVFVAIVGAALIFHQDSRFPNQWNPTTPLVVSDPITPLTGWKLRRTSADPLQCAAAVRAHGRVTAVSSIASDNPNCGAENAITLAALGQAQVAVQTACATALTLAMWEQHAVQPAAREHLGTTVSRILDQGSYNCRPMRTSSGNASRWSTHATAMAIDVRGFRFADGDQAILLRDYDGTGPKARFLRDVRDGGCDWFSTVLGPDYNALHADHFHLQVRGWGTCR